MITIILLDHFFHGFWTIQQVSAFIITATGAVVILGRVAKRLIRQSSETHAKVDAIESLLDQVQKKGMTSGAEKAFERLERRLLLTQAQVRLVMEIDGTGYVESNKEGGLIYCNTQFVHWTGMSVEEAKGFGWAASIHPDDRSRVMYEWTNSVKDQRSIDLLYRYKFGFLETSVRARSIVVSDDRHNNDTLGFVILIVPV